MDNFFGSDDQLKSAFITLTQCEEEEAVRFLPLLITSRNSVARRLNITPITEDAEEELVFLSAAIAAEQWATAANNTEQSIKVGDISLSEKKSSNDWCALVELLEASCAEFLQDYGFFFQNTGRFYEN